MFDDFKQFLAIKRYSPNTAKTYLGLLNSFQQFLGETIPIHQADSSVIRKTFTQKVLKENLAYSTQKQLASATRLYLNTMHNRSIELTTVTPRKPQKVLPDVLSAHEINLILNSITNKKHHTAILVIYALGLRIGELINLKISHIDGQRDQVKIVASKGRKDRYLPLPKDLKVRLREYYKLYKPKEYLIEGYNHSRYSASSLRAVLAKALEKSGINKKVTLHTLRHSYATHLMEAGVNIRVIQELLGHNDIKTTLIYTHVSRIHLEKIPNVMQFLQ